MLTFPAIQDRLIVLASGLIMAAGLAYIVNRMRVSIHIQDTGTRYLPRGEDT